MVIEDIVTAAKYKISKILKLPIERVIPGISKTDEGKISVSFSIDAEGIENFVSEETCKAVINSIWTNEYNVKLIWSLENVKQERQVP